MGNILIKKNQILYQAEMAMTSIAYIAKGSLKVLGALGESKLSAGDLAGITDLDRFIHSNTYIAYEDTVVITYDLLKIEDFKQILLNNLPLHKFLVTSALSQFSDILTHYSYSYHECMKFYQFAQDTHKEYHLLCQKFNYLPKELPSFSNLVPLNLDEIIHPWQTNFYDGLKKTADNDYLFQNTDVLIGIILNGCKDCRLALSSFEPMKEYLEDNKYLLLNNQQEDILDLYTSLNFSLLNSRIDNAYLGTKITNICSYIQSLSVIEHSLSDGRIKQYEHKYKKLKNKLANGGAVDSYVKHTQESLSQSTDIILNYAGYTNEACEEFKALLDQYKSLDDKNAMTPECKQLRLTLTNQFYNLYKICFELSAVNRQVPTIIKMFFNFGYIDEELAGIENAAYLFSIADSYRGNVMLSVYTIYEWLLAIYEGRKEPSKNEFDLDYQEYVHDMKVHQKIDSKEEQLLLDDNAEKVVFELANMFPLTNKATFGRVSTFCPFLSEHQIIKPLETVLTTSDKLCGALEKIRDVDYSLFYRETVFYQKELEISKENISVEVMPDIILLPNIGSRGVMWQEISCKTRVSPARFMVSVFCNEDLDQIMLRLCGEYRFDICKRIQGARWNDISDPSLTSEYCDYAQFYRKNNNLSTDAKDKIKNALTKSRNSYREMFVLDYMTLIQYEGKGSPRLNKVARKILFTYCPFEKNIREQLFINPLFREPIEKWTLKKKQEQHRFNNLLVKLQKNGKDIPKEILDQKNFLEK